MNAALAWSERMSETRGEYSTAGGATDEAAPAPDNVRRLPVRGFTQADNAYYDQLIGIISPTAYYCLAYIVRRTLGYHEDSIKLTLTQLENATNLSRNTVLKALAELERTCIVGTDASIRGRTQVRTYSLLPIDGWILPSTSANNDLVGTSAKSELVLSKNELVGGKTSSKNEPLLNKGRNKLSKQTDANASCAAPHSADATPDAALLASTPPSPKKSRELSAKDQYRVDLLARVTACNDGAKPPNRAQEWAAAARFWTWGKDGTPADIEQVAACYSEERRRPKWDSAYLSLQIVYGCLGAYLRSPTNYRKAIERARAAADGTLDERTRAREREETRHGETRSDTRGNPATYAGTQRHQAASAAKGTITPDAPQSAEERHGRYAAFAHTRRGSVPPGEDRGHS